MTVIQAVFIRGHELRQTPKPHVVYCIEIQTPVRSWNMWRRYSEFVDLHIELVKSTAQPPPQPLPPKNALAPLTHWFKDQTEFTEQRRSGLEAYLRAILAAKEGEWLESYAFHEFLGVPVGKQTALGRDGVVQFSSASWLEEHLELQSRLRDVRAEINRRDTLYDQKEVVASHTANVQAKKKLAEVLSHMGDLTKGLKELAHGGLAEGELQRRTDMVLRLQDECERLGKVVTVARQTSSSTAVVASDREALLGSAKPVTRVFGAALKEPRETEVTRVMDDRGVLEFQKVQMEEQDQYASKLTAVLQRQRHLGEAIGEEVRLHNEMLDGLSGEVDRVANKFSREKKQLNRLG